MSVQIYDFQGELMLKAAVSAFDLQKTGPVFPTGQETNAIDFSITRYIFTWVQRVCVIVAAWYFRPIAEKCSTHWQGCVTVSFVFLYRWQPATGAKIHRHKMGLGQAALSQEMTERLKRAK